MENIKGWIINIVKEIGFFVIFDGLKIPYFVSMLFPVNNRSVFVNCFDGNGYNDNPKYIVENLLLKEPNLKIYWLNKNKKAIPPHQQIVFVTPRSIPAIFRQATSKIWISTVRMPYYSIKRKNQVYIQTWHGIMAFKKVENQCPEALSPRYRRIAKHDSRMIDYFISANKDLTLLYTDGFWYSKGEILEIGLPRNDNLLKEPSSHSIHDSIKAEGKRIALYAPTFRKSGTLDVYKIDYQRVRATLAKRFGGEWVIVVRLHPRLQKKANELVTYNDTVINGSHIKDVQELLAETDILISDYSSISFDYILTRRPVFLFATDIEEYRKDRDFYMDIYDSPFAVAENNDELVDIISRFDEMEYGKKIEAFMIKHGYICSGDASDIMARKIIQLLSL